MRPLSVMAVAGTLVASSAAAFAAELPSYEVNSFPISAVQVQALGGTGVEERATAPATIVMGMPASPAQLAVLSPRVKLLASAESVR